MVENESIAVLVYCEQGRAPTIRAYTKWLDPVRQLYENGWRQKSDGKWYKEDVNGYYILEQKKVLGMCTSIVVE